MGAILDTVVTFLEEEDWSFRQLGDEPILATGFQGENGQWTCFAQAREDAAQLLFYSVCPTNAPEQSRPALAEFLTRANYGMYIGNFELDLDEGDVRYKTCIDVEGDRLSTALVRQLVYANLFTMDRYLQGIMRVVYGSVSPAEALTEIEGLRPG